VEVITGDALQFVVDVLALKYAQALHGADRKVFERLSTSSRGSAPTLPKVGEFILQDTQGALAAKSVLLLGVEPLHRFHYQQIREFGRNVLHSLADAAPQTGHVALTVHGANYELNEIEAFEAEVAGLVDAIAIGDFPQALERVTVIEINPGRADRLKQTLSRLLPSSQVAIDGRESWRLLGDIPKERLRTAGYTSASKPHIFVAMPVDESMDDTFHYGIQGAVNAAGFLCERADLSSFTGDIMDWVKSRIASAQLVIADLSTANLNVYLEVGYAWGSQKSTMFLVRDPDELKFDVKSERCIVYKSIRGLEEALRKELEALSNK
jgi:hypothetical protein